MSFSWERGRLGRAPGCVTLGGASKIAFHFRAHAAIGPLVRRF